MSDVGLRGYVALYGDRAVELAPGVVALRCPEAPGSPMLNRLVGLGAEFPATEELLDRGLATLGDAASYVALRPEAEPAAALPRWLADRGLEPGWGWMQFERPPLPAPRARTELDVREIGAADGDAFARVQRIAYDLPTEVEPWLASLPAIAGWTCWLAFDAAKPAAAGALYVEGESCYVGFGATLPEQRGRGGQGAILAARIERARELGVRRLATETGELREGLPSRSYRNLLRAGFREREVVANWLRPSR
jgi:GNAT superfamily N-acetyltransferase